MVTNSKNFVKKFNRPKLLESFVILYVILGIFMTNDTITLLHYLISIFLQMYLLMLALRNRKSFKRALGGYCITVATIIFIAVNFLVLDVQMIKLFNRIGPLLAVFGIVIVGENSFHIDLKYIVHKSARWYVFFITIINIDALRFMFTGTAIWEPMKYLGYRYFGPFGGPNFMALYSAAMFFVIIKTGEKKGIFQYFAVAILVLNMLLANSLSTYLILAMTFLIHAIWNPKNILKKQIIFLGCYLIGILIFISFKDQFAMMGIALLQRLYGSHQAAIIKYVSLFNRLDTQEKGLVLVFQKLWGYGPLQIVPQLGMDTHNSYVGFFFEQGVLGIILILVSLNRKICKSKGANYMSTYLMLSGLLLNVHYTTIYSLCLIMQFMEDENVFDIQRVGEKNERWSQWEERRQFQ